MKRLDNRCREGMRCKLHLSCPHCSEQWRKSKFKNFCQNLDRIGMIYSDDESITYFVIRSIGIMTLSESLESMFSVIDALKYSRKCGKIGVFYGRIEVSFSVNIGFNAHLNLLCFDKSALIEQIISGIDNIRIWKKKKKKNRDTILSIVWYFLKFNNLGLEMGEAVRKAFKKRRSIIASKEFNREVDYIDDIVDMDFLFMGTYEIRSKEEIALRERTKAKRIVINKEFRNELEIIKKA